MSTNLDTLLVKLSRTREKRQRFLSHYGFMSSCIQQSVVPKGMRVKFPKDALPKSEYLQTYVDDMCQYTSKEILYTCRDTYKSLADNENNSEQDILYQLFIEINNYHQFEAVLRQHHLKSKNLSRQMYKKKQRKMTVLLQQKRTTQCQQNTSQNVKRKNRRFRRRPTKSSGETVQVNTPSKSTNNVVINLSDTTLTEHQQNLLALGPKFCPTPSSLDQNQLTQDVVEGCRLVRLKEFFYDPNDNNNFSPPKFYKKTGYMPPRGRNKALDAWCDILQDRTENFTNNRRFRDNLSSSDRKASKELRDLVIQRQIRISMADKGGAIVVQNVQDYLKEAHQQLSNPDNYITLNKDPTLQITKQSNHLINKLHADGMVDDTTNKWALLDLNKVRTHQFYMLPKVHKSLVDPPGRPIVSSVQGPTENLSKLVDHWLQDYVISLPSYIKDTTHMLRVIQKWNQDHGPFPDGTLLVTLDVTALYSNIPHDELLMGLRTYLNRPLQNSRISHPPTERIIEIADHVLRNNVFKFEDQIFHQIFGTAMGTPMAPSAANLFMGMLESELLVNSPVPVREDFWKRFIDDIFLLWQGTAEDLDKFFSYINAAHPTIKFTMNSSTQQLPFLDILISLQDGFLQTDLHTKTTDCHAYLPSNSCHPHHVIHNMPYSQFLRLRRLCSNNSTFEQRCDQMEEWFKNRGHKLRTIKEARAKARMVPRSESLVYKTKPTSQRTPLIITHHPQNPPLRQWLTELHGSVLHSSDRMKQAVPHPPIVGERNCRSLRSILMPSVLPTPRDATPGCFQCTQRCIICEEHLVETTTFTSSYTKETFTIRHEMSCQSSNVIYLLYCDKCQQAQYIGQTKNTLKTRLYLHRSHIKKNTGTLVTQHFNQTDHSIHDLKCVTVEKVHSDKLQARLAREQFWMKKLQTVTPKGLNSVD